MPAKNASAVAKCPDGDLSTERSRIFD